MRWETRLQPVSKGTGGGPAACPDTWQDLTTSLLQLGLEREGKQFQADCYRRSRSSMFLSFHRRNRIFQMEQGA